MSYIFRYLIAIRNNSPGRRDDRDIYEATRLGWID